MDPRDKIYAELALENGYVTKEQLDACAGIQAAASPPKPLAQVLLEQGRITFDQLTILINVVGYTEGREFRCRKCGETLVVPSRIDSAGIAGDLTPRPGPPVSTTAARNRILAGEGAAPRAFGKYEIIDEIARGGMGIVFKARDRELDRVVAVKVLKEGEGGDPNTVKRFHREAQTAARLRHPNIVAIHDVGSEYGLHYFTMDFVEGEPLDLLLGRNRLRAEDAVRVIEDIARAVQHAHNEGVIHCDVKPGNIMIDREGKALIMDFGLAKSLDTATLLTKSGSAIGTPFYMSPEQVRGDLRRIDGRSDIYSLGVILYEALTAKLPFTGATTMEVYQKILMNDPVPPRRQNPAIHLDLETICLKAMEKDPRSRYPTALELAEDLRRHRQGEYIQARAPSLIEKGLRRMRRHKLPAAVAAVLLLCTSIFLLVLRHRETSGRLEREAEITRLFGDADKQLLDGDPEAARNTFIQILALDPEHGAARTGRVRAEEEIRSRGAAALVRDAERALDQREYATAQRLLERAVEMGRVDPDVRRLMRRARGTGRLTIRTNVDAEVELRPAAGAAVSLGTTPVDARDVDAGYYEVELRTASARHAFPLVVARGDDGEGESIRLDLPLDAPEGMVLVPPGDFVFGGGPHPEKIQTPQNPKTTVDLPAFLIDRREATRADYARFLASLPEGACRRFFRPMTVEGSENNPVAGLNFDQAKYFCLAMGRRLPTEEEWEKAARGVDGRIYPWGDDDARLADVPRRLGSPAAGPDVSPYGGELFSGGVAEWTSNPRWSVKNPGSEGVIRGGHWQADSQDDGRLFFRADFVGLYNLSTVGCRPAWSVLPPGAAPEDLGAHAHFGVRMAALRALPPGHDLVAAALRDPSEGVVFTAVEILRGRREKQLPALVDGLPPMNRVWAATAMLLRGDARARQTLLDGLEEGDASSREAAAWALCCTGFEEGPAALFELLHEQYSNEPARERITARISRAMRACDPGRIHRRLLDSASPQVRIWGLQRIDESPVESAFARLVEMKHRDVHAQVRQQARSALQALGDPEEQVEKITRRLETRSDDPQSWQERGLAHHRLGRLDDAISDYSKALELDPDSHAVLYKRGVARAQKGEGDPAARDFGEAIRLRPAYAQPWGSRGLLHLRARRYAQAVEDFHRFLQLERAMSGYRPDDLTAEAIRVYLKEAESKIE